VDFVEKLFIRLFFVVFIINYPQQIHISIIKKPLYF